jgi:predicted nucleic acid-binding protein
MILFFDTSALIKRYILEIGSNKVDELFEVAENIIVSPVTKIEAYSTLKRLLSTNLISNDDYETVKSNIDYDFGYFSVVSLNEEIEKEAIKLIEKYQLKTLDSIQLASCLYRKADISDFVVSDVKLKTAAEAENIKVIDPTEFE